MHKKTVSFSRMNSPKSKKGFKIAQNFVIFFCLLSLFFSSAAMVRAYAATQITFKGYGYGHGIGLCQWGARGRALAGQNFEQILTHYYQGTAITSNYPVPSTVRVRLFGSSNLSKAYLEGDASSALDFIKTDGTYAYQAGVGKFLVIPTSTGLIKIVQADGTIVADNLTSPIIVTNATNNIIVYDSNGKRKHAYKGSIYIYTNQPSNNSCTMYLVNYVEFEPHYLNGLGEVPSSWPFDALYAQAVAARTYAIKSMKPQATFDLYDDTKSQVYVGVDKVNEVSRGVNWGARWAKAVADTFGKVITYNGQPIAAYYHSSCGGHTENVELAWPRSSAQPYLKGVADIDSSGVPYCKNSANTKFEWQAIFTLADIEKKLGVSGISNFKITKTGASPRIVELEIKKNDGSSVSMSSQDFRSKLGLNSAWVYQMSGSFIDVALDHWAFAEIEDLSSRKIIEGFTNGTFRPSELVTRAQFAKMLAIALNITAAGSSSFSDTSGHWAEQYIAALATQGIVSGYADGTFKPDANITRAEICAIIARALNLSQGTKGIAFSDTSNHWAKDAIDLVASNGIVTGYSDGTFKPNSSATRAEVSVMTYRMLNN